MSSTELPKKPEITISKRKDYLLKIGMAMFSPLLLLLVLELISYIWEQNQADGPYAWEMVASRRMEWKQQFVY